MNNTLKFTIPLLLFISCNKDLSPADGSLVPVFSVTGESTVTGEFAFEAGVDSIYLFTDYILDSGMLNLTGTFGKASCRSLDCPGTLSFTLRIKENETLTAAQNFPFLKNSNLGSDFQTLKITPTDTVNRDFSIQVLGASSLNAPAQANLFNTEPVDINIQAIDRTNLVKSATSLHYLPAHPDSCKAVKLLAKVIDQQVILKAETAGTYETYTWSNGSLDSGEIVTDFIAEHGYAVTVTSPDAGCSAVASLSKLPSSTGGDWISTTGMDVSLSGPFSVSEQAGVRINWISTAGEQFSSEISDQTAPSFFTITKVEPYQVNEKGQRTVQIHISFQCLMVGNSSSINEPFTMYGSGVIGVAIPD